MFLDILLKIFLSVITFFAGLLPEWQLPVDAVSSITGIISNAYAFDKIFPVGTLITVLTASLGVILLVFTWSLIKFIISLLRGN